MADLSSSEAPREGFRGLGGVEGRNLVIDFRLLHGRDELRPKLVAELARLGVDFLLLSGPTYIEPAQQVTKTIPVVFWAPYDPIEAGHQPRAPGGHAHGADQHQPGVSAKRLALISDNHEEGAWPSFDKHKPAFRGV